jgi:type II secretory pathway component HofQ
MDPIKTIKTPTSIVLIDKSGKSVEIIPTTTGEYRSVKEYRAECFLNGVSFDRSEYNT